MRSQARVVNLFCLTIKLVSRPFEAVQCRQQQAQLKKSFPQWRCCSDTGKYRPTSIDETYNHAQFIQLHKTHIKTKSIKLSTKELFAKQLQSKKLSPLLCKLSVMKGYFQEFPLSLQLLFRSELFTVFADTMMRILMVTTMEMKSGRY